MSKSNARKNASLASEVAANDAVKTAEDHKVETGLTVVENKAETEAVENAAKEEIKEEIASPEGAPEEVVAEAKAEAEAETVAVVVPANAPASGGFKIEDNVPMPGAGMGGGKSKYPWNDLKVGQSFFVAGAKPETFYTLCSSQRKKTGKTFISRKVEGGVRVWLSADTPKAA